MNNSNNNVDSLWTTRRTVRSILQKLTNTDNRASSRNTRNSNAVTYSPQQYDGDNAGNTVETTETVNSNNNSIAKRDLEISVSKESLQDNFTPAVTSTTITDTDDHTNVNLWRNCCSKLHQTLRKARYVLALGTLIVNIIIVLYVLLSYTLDTRSIAQRRQRWTTNEEISNASKYALYQLPYNDELQTPSSLATTTATTTATNVTTNTTEPTLPTTTTTTTTTTDKKHENATTSTSTFPIHPASTNTDIDNNSTNSPNAINKNKHTRQNVETKTATTTTTNNTTCSDNLWKTAGIVTILNSIPVLVTLGITNSPTLSA